MHDKNTKSDDINYARLEGWILGFNCAKSIEYNNLSDHVEIDFNGCSIVLKRPYEI